MRYALRTAITATVVGAVAALAVANDWSLPATAVVALLAGVVSGVLTVPLGGRR